VDCGEVFCPDCLILFQGRALCGPCKNFRVRTEQRSSRLSILSLLSLLIGLLTGGLFCIAPAGVEAGAPVVGYIGLIIPLTALVLGILGLREVEKQARVRGRSLAIAGLVIAVVSTFLTVLFIVLLQRQVG
jgi:EamA domain-containing membrane protein RarD